MESIGDFALDIIPRIDRVNLYTGITALESLTKISERVFSTFKGAYGVIDDTADKLRDLMYIGKQLNIPAEQIKVMENTMKKFGLNSTQAATALKSIAKFRGGAPFGEFDTGLIMKAGLLPTDFGQDWKKNIELLSQKYNSTDNVNVRSAIAELVPGLERMLTDPSRLRQYISEAQKQTRMSGVNFGDVEKYGKLKGDMSIALDNLAIAMNNAALPGLTEALKGLTGFLSTPQVQNFFMGIGQATGKAAKFLTEKGYFSDLDESLMLERKKMNLGTDKYESWGIVKRIMDIRTQDKNTSSENMGYPTSNFNVFVKTDGTHADVKIQQADRARNMNSSQNTNKTNRVGN